MPFAALSIFHVASLLFAVAAGIGAWRALPDLSVHEAGFVSLCVLVLGSLFAEGAARRGERRRLLEMLDAEKLKRQALGREVEDLKAKGPTARQRVPDSGRSRKGVRDRIPKHRDGWLRGLIHT